MVILMVNYSIGNFKVVGTWPATCNFMSLEGPGSLGAKSLCCLSEFILLRLLGSIFCEGSDLLLHSKGQEHGERSA